MTIPANMRVPFIAAEFDDSQAQTGPSQFQHKGLLIGQKTGAGTITPLVPTLVSNTQQVKNLAGPGSQLAIMAEAWFAVNKFTPLYIVALDDNGSGVPADGEFVVTGTATASGTLYLYVDGKKIEVTVLSGDAPTAVGDAIEAAINGDEDLPVTASNTAGTVAITAKNDGTPGNDIDLRVNYADGEVFPAGVSVAVTAMANGATDVDVQEALDVLGDEWYTIWVGPYIDATSLTALETELLDRDTSLRMIDAVYVAAKRDTLGTLTTFGEGRNSKYVSMYGIDNVPASLWKIAAMVAARYAFVSGARSSAPLHHYTLPGLLPPPKTDRFTTLENNQLAFSGISTLYTDQAGVMRINTPLSMFQQSDLGAESTAWLRITTRFILMYARFDFVTRIQNKYGQANLADDDTRVGPGITLMTPKVGKAEAIAIFRDWEFAGLVENADQFIEDLDVQRSASDPNRLEWLLRPDLINEFVFGAVKFQFKN